MKEYEQRVVVISKEEIDKISDISALLEDLGYERESDIIWEIVKRWESSEKR